jgi:hypothetical protein
LAEAAKSAGLGGQLTAEQVAELTMFRLGSRPFSDAFILQIEEAMNDEGRVKIALEDCERRLAEAKAARESILEEFRKLR